MSDMDCGSNFGSDAETPQRARGLVMSRTGYYNFNFEGYPSQKKFYLTIIDDKK